jgi:dUTP pyrophosphatase
MEKQAKNIKVKLLPGATLPVRGSAEAAGWDLHANINRPVSLQPGDRYTFPTGVCMQLPPGTFLKIESRSGLARKNGVIAAGGVIDSDYTGEIGVILFNLGEFEIRIGPGERIAQGIMHRYEEQHFEVVDELGKTERGAGGFGHTGK